MPQKYPLTVYYQNDRFECYVFSDDTIAMIKLRISSKTKLPLRLLIIEYSLQGDRSFAEYSSGSQNSIKLKNDSEWENCTLVSSLVPVPVEFRCYVNTDLQNSVDLTELAVYYDNSIDDLKNKIELSFCKTKYDFHQVITVPSVLFKLTFTPDSNCFPKLKLSEQIDDHTQITESFVTPTPPTTSIVTTQPASTPNGPPQDSFESIWNICKISKNVPCIIESTSQLDPPKIYLYKDVVSLEPNSNVICNWWKCRTKQQPYKYTIHLRSNSEVFGNNQYSSLLINRNSDVYYEWSYSTPIEISILKSNFGSWIQKNSMASFNVPFQLQDKSYSLIMKECSIKYEVFLSVDLFELFDCCSETLDMFFETPSEDKRFNLRYRPKYCSNMPTDCIINVKFQKMNQNNSILIAIFAQQATWLAIEDVIKVLFYLFEHERLRDITPTEVSYKDLDPYLYKTNVRGGGYTRQCLNYYDNKISKKPVKRYKVPKILFTKEDFEMYNALPDEHKRNVLYYRGNYYAAIDDYRNNKDTIETYNKKAKSEGKKTESFLNTVVLFEIQQKYRDGTQEQLYYPGCVRAKSGLPPIKHQYILQKLLRNGEIKLTGKDAAQMQKKLETNEMLKRGDVIHYISKFVGRLTSDSYANLPTLVKKMLVPLFTEKDTRELIRKGVLDGEFVHAVVEACNINYRTSWAEQKIQIVKNTMSAAKEVLTEQMFRWIYFGQIARQMTFKTFVEQFENYQKREHIYLCDILSMLYDVNIFVIHLNSNGILEKITRSCEFESTRPSVIIIKFHKSYEIVMKLQRNKRKTTHEDNTLWSTIDPLIVQLNNIFIQIQPVAKHQLQTIQKYSLDTSNNTANTTTTNQQRHISVGQVVDIYNRCVGVLDCYGYLLAFKEPCAPFSFLPMFSNYFKKTLALTLLHLQQHPTELYNKTQTLIVEYPKTLSQPRATEGGFDSDESHLPKTQLPVIVAIQTFGGEIIPCLSTPLDNVKNGFSYVENCGQLICKPIRNCTEIPYKESVTHYQLKLEKANDQRIKLTKEKIILKQSVGLILSEFKKIIASFPPQNVKSWEIMATIRNVRKRQESLYPIFMTILDRFIIEQCPTNGLLFRFQSDKTKIVNSGILEKAVFQCFHYIVRSPMFGLQSDTNTSNSIRPITNDCIVFDSTESAEDYIRSIQLSDDSSQQQHQHNVGNNDSGSGSSCESLHNRSNKAFTRYFEFKDNSLELFSSPLIFQAVSNSQVNATTKEFMAISKYSKTYLARKLGQMEHCIAHLELLPFAKKCLLFSLVFSRTVIVQGLDGTFDKYNSTASNESVDPIRILIKKNK